MRKSFVNGELVGVIGHWGLVIVHSLPRRLIKMTSVAGRCKIAAQGLPEHAGVAFSSAGTIAAKELPMFRIPLRDLFWATLVVALGLGWWAHVRQLNRELASVQSDLLYQADYVTQFVSCFKNLGCEIPPDSDPRCANGGPYTRIFFTEAMTKATGCISSTLSGPRSELQRTLDGEYGSRYRNSPAVQAARAARGEPGPVTGQRGRP
jgi:hypothetical protein